MNLILFGLLTLPVTLAVSTGTTQLNNGSINMTISLPTTTTMRWEITTADTNWVAIGFGTSMTNVDMITIQNEGTWTVEDRYSTGHSLPPADTTNNVNNFAVSMSGSTNTYTFERALNTGDSQDFTVSDELSNQFCSKTMDAGCINMIYGYGNGANFAKHSVGAYGQFNFTIKAATRDVFIGEDSTVKVDTEQTLVHGLLNYIAWGWLSFLLIVTGRYSKYFYSFRTMLHGLVGILALVFTLVAVLGYGKGGRTRASLNSMGDEHKSISGVVSIWAAITVIFGMIMKIFGVFFGRFSFVSYYLWYAHVIVGSLLIVYSQFAILSGLFLYDSPITFLYYIHLTLMVLMLIICEVLWQLNQQWKYTAISEFEKKGLPEMTIEEVQNSKRKLAIFDQYVIDFGKYQYDHPGGKYVLEECAGKEIGKYFYGAYSLDDNIKTHKHSFVAGKILKKIAIAKLKSPEDTQKMVTSRFDDINGIEDRSNELYTGNFRVKQKDELFKGVYRVTFKNDTKGYKVIVPGISSFGRHYLIHSEDQKVSRYYTICNVMNSEIYPVYINAIDKILGNQTEGEVTLDNVEEISQNLQLVIKFYDQSKKGLTRLLANVQDRDEFIISKPLGKGLDLRPEAISGTNVLFLGGTGVLPFLDLFAYLARMVIRDNSPSDSLIRNEEFDECFKDSKFIVYGYYPTQGEAVALDFLMKLSDLFSHFQKQPQFSFTPVFTRQGGEHLTSNSLYSLLDPISSTSTLRTIWVCGPPKMNNLFQRIHRNILSRYEDSAVEIM
ncbi:unnamed protein product [Moneuplotes crassus]|uniref:Uncharacterized protein n=1 Tax=Euplotes crassus TaxID=5936 RepID=A0AAD2DA48_EUPCR|nr:unnamed protein product [Moneuplotes crassus]